MLAWVVRGPEDSDAHRASNAKYTADAGTPEEPRNLRLAIREGPSFFWGFRRATKHPGQGKSSRRCSLNKVAPLDYRSPLPRRAVAFRSPTPGRRAATQSGKTKRSKIEASSFSGLFTRVEIGHIVMGSAG